MGGAVRRRAPLLLREAAWAAMAALVSMLLAIRVLGLAGRWHRPLDLSNDANLNAMVIKAVVDHGWALQNPDLGAPAIQRLHDFPFADNLSLAIVRLLAVFSGDWPFVMNLLYVVTFGLVAITGYAVARRFAVGRPFAGTVAVLFALAPYHFLRGEQHLFLSNYLAVPLAVALCLDAGRGRALVRRPGAPLAGWLTADTAFTLGAVVVLASSVQYYPLFAVGLVVLIGVARAMATRSWRAGVDGIAVAVLLTTAFVLNLLPNLWYRLHEGANEEVARRTLGETAIFSFRLIDLVLPMAQHRIGSFRDLSSAAFDAFGPPPEFGATALGAVASVGLFLVLAHAVIGLVGRRALRSTDRHAAALVVFAILLGTRGGLSGILAATVGLPLRAWNRLSIFIAFLSLLALGRVASRLLLRLPSSWRPVVAVTVAAVVATIGVLDQTSDAFRVDDVALRARWEADQAFVRRVERALPANAMVLQLPYLPFPENGPFHKMADYDPLRGYLHSERLRWSYGAMRNRPADIGRGFRALPAADLVPVAAALGYDGIWLDRAGLDVGSTLEQDLEGRIGGQPIESADGRLVFLSLLQVRRDLRATIAPDVWADLQRRSLAASTFRFGAGFYREEADFDRHWVWMGESSILEVQNPLHERRRVVLQAEIETAGGAPAQLLVGGRTSVAVAGGGETDAFEVELQPGVNRIRLRTTVPAQATGDGRDLRLRVIDLRVTDAVVAHAGDLAASR